MQVGKEGSMWRKLSVLNSITYALEEVAHSGGKLPGKVTSLFNLTRQYNTSISLAEFKEVMETPLIELFPVIGREKKG